MATIKEKIEKKQEVTKESIKEVANKNANLFTFFAVAVILVAGTGLINGRATWWLSGVALLAFFAIVFFFLNLKVLIKIAFSFLILLFTSNFALSGGIILDGKSSIGLVWMTAQLFLFFGVLALSYLTIGNRSRWTGATLTLLVSFAVVTSLIGPLPPTVAVSLGIGFGFLFFALYYKYSGFLNAGLKSMPINLNNTEVMESVFTRCEEEGWECRELNYTLPFHRKDKQTSFLIWKDEHAYVLHPLTLNAKFSISPSKRSTKLVHRGVSLNPWLLLLVNKALPLWKSRNASMMLILLDSTNTNGLTAETIGVSIPDSGKKIPVGVYPAKGFLGTKKKAGVLEDIDATYGTFIDELTNRQKEAMAEIGITENSTYLEPISSVDS